MTRVALSNLQAHPVRLLATALSVVLGIAFVAGTFILTDTARAALDDLFGATGAEQVDVVVRPARPAEGPLGGGAGAGVPARVVDVVAAVEGVAAVAPAHNGPALLLGPSGSPLSGSGLGGPPSAVNWIDDDALRDQVLRSGRAPDGPGEVAVDGAIAAEHGLAVGDGTRLAFGNAVVDAEVVGTFGYGHQASADEDAGSVGVRASVALDTAAAAERFGDPATLRVRAAAGADAEALRADIARALDGTGDGGGGYEAVEGAMASQQTGEGAGQILGAVTTGLLAFAGVSLLVAGAIIFNTFTITVAQRTREFALLRALGAGRRQVTAAVLLEALAVGLTASAVGLLVGLGLAVGLRVLLDAVGLAIPGGDLVLRPRTAALAVGLGVGVSMLAALLPAARANRVPPVQALRDPAAAQAGSARSGARRVRLAAGALVGLTGATALAVGLATDGAPAALGGGALGVVLAVVLLGPLFTAPVAHWVGAPVAAVRGVPGHLARANAARNPARTASTAAALMIGLALVSASLVLAASLQASVARLYDEPLAADFQVFSPNFVSFPETATQALADVEGVATVSAIKSAQVGIAGAGYNAVGIQPDTFSEVLAVQVLAGDLDALAQDTATGDPTGEAPIALADDLGVGVGETVQVTFPGADDAGPTQARVVATFDPDSFALGAPALVSYDRLDAAAPQAGDNGAFVALAEGVTLDQARPALQAALDDFPTAHLLDADTARAQTQAGANQLLGLVFGLLLLSIVIALFGITNTLGLSVLERTRELGLLRAVGLTRAQTRVMVRWEAVIVAVLGALLGLAVGVLFGWVAVSALPSEFEAFALPVGQLALAVVVTALAGILAAVIPARRASRVDVLRAITVE